MNLFSKSFLKRHQLTLLFIVIWLHISLLDLFFVTYAGPVFLWKENSQLTTIVVHLLIAFLSTGLYWLIRKPVTPETNKSHENQ